MISTATRTRLAWLHATAGTEAARQVFMREGGPDSPRWPVASGAGKRLLKRRFVFAGCDVEMAGQIVWQAEASDSWHREFYGFRWLQDVAATQTGKIAASFVREYINGFITEPESLGAEAWEPGVAGERLAEWLYHRRFALSGSSLKFQKRFIRSVAAHIRYLASARDDGLSGDDLLGAAKGLAAASTYLPSLKLNRAMIESAVDEAAHQLVMTDGTHVSRSPERLLDCLESMIEIRHLLEAGGGAAPQALLDVIESLGTALRFFCHGDGRLALFGGGTMGDEMLVTHAISHSDNGADIPTHLIEGAFFRLEHGALALLVAGSNDASPLSSDGSFELSEAGERFIVNCGGYRGTSETWARAANLPAAQSTLSLELDGTSGEMTPALALISNLQETPSLPADQLTADAVSLIARTSRMIGTANAGGVHEREIRLSRTTRMISGKDVFRLTASTPETTPRIRLDLRFHLHPDIRCQRQKEGTVSLTSVGGVSWSFSASPALQVQIEESVFLGYHGKPQKTLQIVVSADLTGRTAEFHWQLQRRNEYDFG